MPYAQRRKNNFEICKHQNQCAAGQLSHGANADLVNHESKSVSCPVELLNSKPPFPFYVIKTFVVINAFIDLVLLLSVLCICDVLPLKRSSIILTRAFT
jgi:hypothetical protein